MKFRIIIACAALLTALIGIRCLTKYVNSPRRSAAGIAMELSSKISKPPGGPFELIQTSFLDWYDDNVFYVVLDFKGHTPRDKLQEVFYFDAADGKPRMEWSYSVLNNLAKLNVSVGAFCDDGNSRIQQKGQDFKLPIALTPVADQYQAETIARLGRHGVQMSVSIERHPELKSFRIISVNDMAECITEFPSKEDALHCAKVLDIKLTN